jgi:hypothetical protein
MSAALQSAVVLVVVAIAATYATWKLMPAAWRRALAGQVASWGSRAGLSAETARRVEAKLATGGACGSCDSCRACATPAAGSETPSQRGYRHIPIRRAS